MGDTDAVRKKFVAANWKMNTTREEAVALARGVVEGAPADGVDLAVCPPFVYLDHVARALERGPVALGAQNMYFESSGAFTGEISAAMLKDVGCRYVILGHSERRHVIGEPDQLIGAKVKAALISGLDPILCVGETLDERRADRTLEVVERHVRTGLAEVAGGDVTRVTIAYEPVWAIGTGVTATPEQAQEIHAQIRALLAGLYDDAASQSVRIQYGGSVKPDNAHDIFAQPDVDGGLIGGAGLKVETFLPIARAAVALAGG